MQLILYETFTDIKTPACQCISLSQYCQNVKNTKEELEIKEVNPQKHLPVSDPFISLSCYCLQNNSAVIQTMLKVTTHGPQHYTAKPKSM